MRRHSKSKYFVLHLLITSTNKNGIKIAKMCLKRVEKYIRCAIIYHISECFICDGEAMDIAFVIFFIVKKFRRETTVSRRI